MKKAWRLLVLLVLVLSSGAYAQPVVNAPGYTIELLVSGIGAATGMALSPSGDLFVTDYAGGRVLRIEKPSSGKPRTAEVYATGIAKPDDLAFAFGKGKKTSGKNAYRLFVANGTSSLVEVTPEGATTSFGAGFSFPVGVTAFGHDLYIGNSGDGTISRTDGNGVSSPYGPSFQGPNGVFGVTFDDIGNLYCVVHGTGQVYQIAPDGSSQLLGAVTPLGGVFVATPPSGDYVLVSDVIAASVYVMDDAGVRVFASGFAGKSNPPFNGPNDLVLDGSILYVADGNNVWRIMPTKQR